MKHIAIIIIIVLSSFLSPTKTHAQVHAEPVCGQNFYLNWSTNNQHENYWPPGKLSNTYDNVDGSDTNITITFTGETSTLGYWSGETPKIGTQSSYLYKGIDLLSNGFNGTGITCTITFSKPIYALSFDIHHINKWQTNGDKYTFTGKDINGNTIYPQFTSSKNPTYSSDSSTGVVNANSNLTSGDNSLIGVNFSDSNLIKSISFLWEDCDTCDHNLPHATGIGNFSFCLPQILDFDGEDDYINRNAFLGGKSNLTMMAWFKSDNGPYESDIIGQRNFRLFINSDKKLKAFIKTNSGLEITSPNLERLNLKYNSWYHTALKFDSNNGKITLYLNGEAIWNYADNALIGTSINNTEEWNSNHDFEIGRNSEFENNYFEGSIYECRVYNKALTETQLHQQINQEIENNNGKISGSVMLNDIEGLVWDDLLLYYSMDDVNTGYTLDKSNSNTQAKLNNMSIHQKTQNYTAPLPYITKPDCDGDWSSKGNWLHGDVWPNITENVPSHSIVEINGNLKIDENTSNMGLIINNNSVLRVTENAALYNTLYLKLDGTIYLEEESQLIQTKNSILNTTNSGVLEKDLKGTADNYTYKYWSSPVGKINNSSLNNDYTVKDVFPDVNFLTTGHDGASSPLSISDYWIWKFNNNLSDNYASWQHVRSTGIILPGEGFTMKGPGSGDVDDEQDYKLRGKPNNGDINLPVFAGNDYLVGNPYPSAIDAVKFIQDNKSISDDGATNGTLYFWKHWGGGSHIASDYQGGYATFSLSGGVPAASSNSEINISNSDIHDEVPNRYIPVGQGFYTTADTDGYIKFNNDQRLFHIENNEGPFYKGENSKKSASENYDPRTKLRIGFNSVNDLHRQLLITVDENASKEYDWGYDSKYIDTQIDDMYWLINNGKFIIQGINQINEQTIIPIGLHTKTEGLNSINIDEIKNVPNSLEIYLHDKELNTYHDLRQAKYETHLASGEHLNRFEITFSKNQTLDTNENISKQIEMYYSNEKNSIVLNNPSSKLIKTIEMFNMLGQTLFKFQTNTTKNHIAYNANQIKTGNYILKIDTEFGTISKKVHVRK